MLNDDELKETMLLTAIQEHTQRSTRAGRNMYNCPFCMSGTGEHKTGALGVFRNKRTGVLNWGCRQCGRGGDIGDFIAEIENIPKNQGMKRARELYANRTVYDEPTGFLNNVLTHELPATAPAETNNKIMDYLRGRGFSDDTINDFNLGWFIDKFNDLRLAIPTNENHIIGRRIADKNDNFNKMNYGGDVSLFNVADLYNADKKPVFICEGWADAMSIYEGNGYAIATNSVSNYRKVIETLKQQPTNNQLIISFDNDKDGDGRAEDLKNELQKLGYNSIRFKPEQFKDLNEWLVNDRNNFLTAIQEAEKEAEAMKPRTEQQPVINQEATTQEPATNYKENYLINHIDGIIKDTRSQKFKAVSTGFLSVDKMLNGGLFAGLSVIGAESSMGKSTLIMNIGENLAESGHDVLYFSLEMSVSQLVMRGLSKQSFLLNKKKKGYESAIIKNNQAGDLSKIIEAYKNKIAGNMIIIPNKAGGFTVEDICNTTENHIKATGKQPIVIVDYLQYIASKTESNLKLKVDHSVQELKTLSMKHNLIILAISSINRNSYGQELQMDSFKESGNIEYTADLLLGLYFSKSNAKNGQPLTPNEFDEEKDKTPREMTLKTIKGRDIESGIKTELRYFSKYNYFDDILNDWNKYQNKQNEIKEPETIDSPALMIPRDNKK